MYVQTEKNPEKNKSISQMQTFPKDEVAYRTDNWSKEHVYGLYIRV